MPMLVSVADFESYLGIEVTNDLQVAQVIEAVSQQVISWSGQQFIRVDDDVAELHVTPDPHIWLPQRPVIDVSEVVVEYLYGPAVTIPGAQLKWRQDGLLVRPWQGGWIGNGPESYDPWGCAPFSITVTYSHGYDDIPMDVQAVVMQAGRRYLDNPQAIRAEVIGHYNVSYNIAASGEPAVAAGYPVGITLTGGEKRVLARYRRRTHVMSLR